MFTLISTLSLFLFTQNPYTIDYLIEPPNEVLEVGGMDFMSNGDMIVSTRRGQVWRINNPEAENPDDATFTLICEGLHEGLGLVIIDDVIYVMQRSEVSKLLDLNGDGLIDEVKTITQEFGLSGNYHEFGFGLPADSDGNLYFSLNVGFWNPHWWHGKSRAPYRGWVLKVSPDGRVTPIAGGLRSPAGMGFLENGTLLVTDNQGDWMAACPVYAIKEGAFYGHPASLRWYEDQPNIEPSDTQPHPEVEREHPALWLPYQWSRSTGNIIQDNTGGPFDGQYYIAELTNGQILRAEFEEIDGILQGACWLAHQGVGSSYHIKFGPDGTLYSGMTNRGWGGLAPGSGIARVKYNSELPLEMRSAHLTKSGFDITFTKPLEIAPEVFGQKYDYNYWWEYGSPQQHLEDLNITNISLAEDGMSATIDIDNLEAGKCVMLKLVNAISIDGSPILHNEVSYTINKMPGGELRYVAKRVEPPVERGERVEGWLYLTWSDAFDVWNNNGVTLVDAELDIHTPTQFITSDGMGALVAQRGDSMETTFTAFSGDIKMSYMLAEGGEMRIRLPNGMSYTISDTPTAGYLAPGIWHDLRMTYSDGSINQVEINGVVVSKDLHAEINKPQTLKIQCINGTIAFGDVRLRQTQTQSVSSQWARLEYNDNSIETNGDVEWQRTDGGELVFRGNGTITIPHASDFSAIRFDTKMSGNGIATIKIGDVVFDVATQGERKTGGINGHPIRANLIDQHEWCTVELQDGSSTYVFLNEIPLYQSHTITFDTAPIIIELNDAELSIRRIFIQ